jgi:hypothetical protein
MCEPNAKWASVIDLTAPCQVWSWGDIQLHNTGEPVDYGAAAAYTRIGVLGEMRVSGREGLRWALYCAVPAEQLPA